MAGKRKDAGEPELGARCSEYVLKEVTSFVHMQRASYFLLENDFRRIHTAAYL